MARKPRIHYEGALYHVVCRGNNREWVFKEKAEKAKYLEIVRHYKKKYAFKLYAYCIMDNHVHLLIEVGQFPLSKIMQGIQQVFTQQYNKQHQHTGHVFEQRYKAVLCDKDQYLLGLINYIHMNPVRAHFESGADYEWSSHASYLKKNSSNIVDTSFPLSMFGGNLEEQRKRYINFMSVEDTMIKEMKTSEFSEEIDEYEIIKRMNDLNETAPYESPEVVIDKVCKTLQISCDELRMKTKKPSLVKAKRLAIYALKELAGATNTEISEAVNISMTTVTTTLGNVDIREKIGEELGRIRQSKA